jgi:cell wall-active antibiotic response 4TMS protein YvqF
MSVAEKEPAMEEAIPMTHETEPAPRPQPVMRPPAAYDPRAKSPALACVLSAMPGLGQVYVGYYQRGFVHAVVAGGIIAILAQDVAPQLTPMLGLFLAFFWLYNVIDAGRRAAFYNHALQGASPFEMPEDLRMPAGGSVLGGLVLIGFGAILLLHTRFNVPLEWLKDWWPVAPILFGGWLVWKGIEERRAA